MNDELNVPSMYSVEVTSAAEEESNKPLAEALDNPEIRKLLDEEQIYELYDVFCMFDIDESGSIDVKELKQVMYDLKMNPSEEDIKKMIE